MTKKLLLDFPKMEASYLLRRNWNCVNKNHSVRTMTDAAHHMAEKKISQTSDRSLSGVMPLSTNNYIWIVAIEGK